MPTYTPPQSVADNAQMALDKRQQMPPSHQGMTAIGLARANQLANRQPVSIETIQRMVSYFARHEVDKQGSTWNDWGPGRQAWNGWGGDEGRTWSQSILQEYEKMQVKAGSRHSAADMEIIRAARKASKSIAGYMQQLGDDMQDDDDTEITSAGANGSHYMPAEQNVFMAKGIYCEHCYFYQPDYQCAIVDAIIDPMALCKFWVIPQSEITEAMAESEVIAVVEVVEPMEAVDTLPESEPTEPMVMAMEVSEYAPAEPSEAAQKFARKLIGIMQ